MSNVRGRGAYTRNDERRDDIRKHTQDSLDLLWEILKNPNEYDEKYVKELERVLQLLLDIRRIV